MLDYFDATMQNPGRDPDLVASLREVEYQVYRSATLKNGQPFNDKSLYDDPRYKWAKLATVTKFGCDNISLWFHNLFNGTPDQGTVNTVSMASITHVFGYETIRNTNMTANSGMHGQVVRMGIESQPMIEGAFFSSLRGDFGSAHSLALLSDSMVLQRALAQLDVSFTNEKFISILAASTNRVPSDFANSNYEVDALKNILDALRRTLVGPGVTATPFKEGGGGFGDWESRNRFTDNVAALVGSAAFQSLKGKVIISPSSAQVGTQAKARVDFESVVSLSVLSPMKISVSSNDAAYAKQLWNSAGWGVEYQQWLDDKSAIASGNSAIYISDQWIEDRAAMLDWLDVAGQ